MQPGRQAGRQAGLPSGLRSYVPVACIRFHCPLPAACLNDSCLPLPLPLPLRLQAELHVLLKGFEEHGVEFAGPAPLAAAAAGGVGGGAGSGMLQTPL